MNRLAILCVAALAGWSAAGTAATASTLCVDGMETATTVVAQVKDSDVARRLGPAVSMLGDAVPEKMASAMAQASEAAAEAQEPLPDKAIVVPPVGPACGPGAPTLGSSPAPGDTNPIHCGADDPETGASRFGNTVEVATGLEFSCIALRPVLGTAPPDITWSAVGTVTICPYTGCGQNPIEVDPITVGATLDPSPCMFAGQFRPACEVLSDTPYADWYAYGGFAGFRHACVGYECNGPVAVQWASVIRLTMPAGQGYHLAPDADMNHSPRHQCGVLADVPGYYQMECVVTREETVLPSDGWRPAFPDEPPQEPLVCAHVFVPGYC